MTTIADSTLTPGVSLGVNLIAGQRSPGSAPQRGLLIACKSSGGDAGFTASTDLRQGMANAEAVGLLFGPGTPGHLASKAIFAECPLATLDVIAAPAPSGNSATQTVVFDDTTPVTVAQTITLNIHGRDVQYVWAAGIDDITAATGFVAAVNDLDADLAVSATNTGGASATVDITFKHKGTMGNDVLLTLTVADGTGGSVVLTGGALTGGTTEPVLTTLLATIAGKKYDLILWASGGNTAADLASASSGVGVLKAQMITLASGFSAKLQQMVVGVTGSLSGALTGTAQHDFGPLQYVFCRSGRSLGCEFAGAEVGARLREEAIDPAVNRTNRSEDMPYIATLYGPLDLTTGRLTAAEMESALQGGLSPVDFTFNGTPYMKMPRTTYWADSLGNPDHRLIFVSQVTGIYRVADDIVSWLPSRFPGAKIVRDLPPGADELPPNVVDEGTVKANVIARLRDWQRRGVLSQEKLDAAILAGTLYVVVDSTVASKLNIQLPLSILAPLTQFDVSILGVAA